MSTRPGCHHHDFFAAALGIQKVGAAQQPHFLEIEFDEQSPYLGLVEEMAEANSAEDAGGEFTMVASAQRATVLELRMAGREVYSEIESTPFQDAGYLGDHTGQPAGRVLAKRLPVDDGVEELVRVGQSGEIPGDHFCRAPSRSGDRAPRVVHRGRRNVDAMGLEAFGGHEANVATSPAAIVQQAHARAVRGRTEVPQHEADNDVVGMSVHLCAARVEAFPNIVVRKRA